MKRTREVEDEDEEEGSETTTAVVVLRELLKATLSFFWTSGSCAFRIW